MLNMGESKDNQQKATNKQFVSSHNILVAFFSALMICCVLYGYVIYRHNGHIVEGQNRIIRIYEQQLDKLESERIPVNMREAQREKEMEAFHLEVKSLLELEFNRIQNEFEAIEIWAGILTVIFLIFSFYSLFKTEQLENQSKDELRRLKIINEDGSKKLEDFESNSKNALNSLNSSVEQIRKDAKKIIEDLFSKEKSDSLSDIGERAKEILEAYKAEIKDSLTSNLDAIEKRHDLFVQKLQSIAEKDLDMDEAGEKDLDEEELRKDKEKEDKED